MLAHKGPWAGLVSLAHAGGVSVVLQTELEFLPH